MTRDEALEIEFALQKRESAILQCGAPDPVLMELARCNVDRGVRLGMLKLDEPKSVRDRFWDACIAAETASPDDILRSLDRAGLKIDFK